MDSFRYLIVIAILLMLFQNYHAGCFEFSFPAFISSQSYPSITMMNDAFVSSDSISLTKDSTEGPSVGRMFYNSPIPLWTVKDSKVHMASFTTTFRFRIKNTTTVSGDGMAFLLSGSLSPAPANSETDGLGIIDPTLDGQHSNHIVAVEFDTYKDDKYLDVNSNHVGIDINSLKSSESGSLYLEGIDLRNGDLLSAWIVYKMYSTQGTLRSLSVYISDDTTSYEIPPGRPFLYRFIDLSQYLPREIYVGFSAATWKYVELHEVHSWQFNSTDLPSVTTPPPDKSSNTPNNGQYPSQTSTNTNSNNVNATVNVNNTVIIKAPAAMLSQPSLILLFIQLVILFPIIVLIP